MNNRQPLPPIIFISCIVTGLSYAALLGVFVFVNVSEGSFGLWCLQSLPLLLLAPALIKLSYRAYSGLCMLILVYFVATVPVVMTPTAHWHHHIVLGLTLLILLSSMYSSRWLQRWQKCAN